MKMNHLKYDVSIGGVLIGGWPHIPNIHGNAFTVCEMLDDLDCIRAMEIALDTSPIAEVTRLDEPDPPRRKASCFSGGLAELVEKRSREDNILILSKGSGRMGFGTTRFDTMIYLHHLGHIGPPGKRDAGYSDISFTLHRKNISPADIQEFKKMFVDVCVAVNAFYGRAAEDAIMFVQRDLFMAKAVPHPLMRKKIPDFDRELWDVYWLNYFGPGYVRFWGNKKIDRLAEQYEVTKFDNGAVCVQTTPAPVFADPNAKGITDYPWKKHMYDVLGWNTFMHETHKQGEPGQYVPPLEDHRRLLKQK